MRPPKDVVRDLTQIQDNLRAAKLETKRNKPRDNASQLDRLESLFAIQKKILGLVDEEEITPFIGVQLIDESLRAFGK